MIGGNRGRLTHDGKHLPKATSGVGDPRMRMRLRSKAQRRLRSFARKPSHVSLSATSAQVPPGQRKSASWQVCCSRVERVRCADRHVGERPRPRYDPLAAYRERALAFEDVESLLPAVDVRGRFAPWAHHRFKQGVLAVGVVAGRQESVHVADDGDGAAWRRDVDGGIAVHFRSPTSLLASPRPRKDQHCCGSADSIQSRSLIGHSFPSSRSTAQHPRTCGPGPRRWFRISASPRPPCWRRSASPASRTASISPEGKARSS